MPAADYKLRERLEEIAPREVVIIDTPPAVGVLMFLGLVAADEALIPVDMGAQGITSLEQTSQMLAEVRRVEAPDLDLAGVHLVQYREKTRVGKEMAAALENALGNKYLGHIRADIKVREAPDHEQDLLAYAPTCRASEDYRELGRKLGTEGGAHG